MHPRAERQPPDAIDLTGPRQAALDARAATMAGVLAAMAAAGATLTLVWLALPHDASARHSDLVAVALAGYALAAVGLWGLRHRLPDWAFQSLIVAGSILVTLGVFFSGRQSSSLAYLYLWIGLYVSYFFTPRQAAAHVSLIALLYMAVLALLNRQGDTPAPNWLALVATLVLIEALVISLKGRARALIDALGESARKDPLTGLLNRRGLQEAFELELERFARQGGDGLCLLYADLDGFKHVNDRLGHETGDAMLARTARLLTSSVRKIDSVARIGGEEFALLAPRSGLQGAQALAERIRRRFERKFGDEPIPVTVSLGIARYTHGQSLDSLLQMADQALYAAKYGGRNRSVTYDRDALAELVRTARRRATSIGHLTPLRDLADTLDSRNDARSRHSRSVAEYAEAIAAELGLDDEARRELRLAAALHDIGTIGVPATIIHKPAALSELEWQMVRRHSEIGASAIRSAGLSGEADIVLGHHERIDGSGYPGGLAGDEIPLGARILAVADAYDAMTTPRPYRAQMGPESAVREIERGAGTQFDSEVVAAFLRLLEDERSPLRMHAAA